MTNAAQPTKRFHHFDLLRAVMLLLIVLTHVAHIYYPGAGWIISSPESTALAPIVSDIPVFSMPGFFMISSLLSVFLLRKRSHHEWAQGRLRRIAIPLVSGILILSPITIYYASLAATAGASGSSDFVGNLGADFGVLDRRWIGHLWFLSTLGIFTLIAWWGLAKGFFLAWLESLSNTLVKANDRLSIWWGVVAFMGLWSFGTKAAFYLLKTQLGFEPTIIALLNVDTLFSYFPIFILGMMLGVSERLREILFEGTLLRVWILGITFTVYVLGSGIEFSEWRLARKFISMALGTGIALFLFGYLADKIQSPNATVKQISKYSYSVYLLHYPILHALAYYFLSVQIDPTLEFIVLIISTYCLSFGAAWIVDRIGLLRLIFNGEPMTRTPPKIVQKERKRPARNGSTYRTLQSKNHRSF